MKEARVQMSTLECMCAYFRSSGVEIAYLHLNTHFVCLLFCTRKIQMFVLFH